MPIKFHFPTNKNLVISVHEGIVKDEELIASYKSLLEDNLFDKEMNFLIDLRETDSSSRSREGLNSLAKFVRTIYQDKYKIPKVAVLAPSDISFGLARVFEGISNDIPINYSVFRSSEEALTWLDTPNGPIELN